MSVCGTGARGLPPGAFLGGRPRPNRRGSPPGSPPPRRPLAGAPARLDAASPAPRSALPAPSPGRTCSSARGDGISTVCPSATPFGLALGPTHPPRMDLAEETSAIRGPRFPRGSRYSCRHSRSRRLHRPSRDGFAVGGTLPYHPRPDGSGRGSAASAPGLTPLHCRRARTRPVSCYALFEGWLLLSQPPGCLCDLTSFTT